MRTPEPDGLSDVDHAGQQPEDQAGRALERELRGGGSPDHRADLPAADLDESRIVARYQLDNNRAGLGIGVNGERLRCVGHPVCPKGIPGMLGNHEMAAPIPQCLEHRLKRPTFRR